MHVVLMVWHWLLAVTGVHIPPGVYSNWYNFWSGFGSDLGELAIIGSVLAVYKHHNCGVRGCWRIGRHPVKGTPYLTCHKHTTQAVHRKLHKQHEHDYPEQHEFLNPGE